MSYGAPTLPTIDATSKSHPMAIRFVLHFLQ